VIVVPARGADVDLRRSFSGHRYPLSVYECAFAMRIQRKYCMNTF
jgi:hypothetical protein